MRRGWVAVGPSWAGAMAIWGAAGGEGGVRAAGGSSIHIEAAIDLSSARAVIAPSAGKFLNRIGARSAATTFRVGRAGARPVAHAITVLPLLGRRVVVSRSSP